MSAAPAVTVRTRKECRKLIKDRASISYNSTTKDVLFNLFNGTYHPQHNDAEGRKVTRTLKSLMRGVPIELRQFERIVKHLQADGILLDYSRDNGHITYSLDFSPLEALEGVDAAAVKKARNESRAAKAREQREFNRLRQKPVLRASDVEQFYEDYGLDGLPLSIIEPAQANTT